ncbi:MAG: porin [Hydrogenophaga sp.]|nr:porin [Hydrogenophaga sp.]
MKKSLIALAVLAASGAAMAQSSVTLYGRADVGVGSEKVDGVSSTKMINGGLTTSRWGLRGSEDLGGGLKAQFKFEQRLDLSTGEVQSPSFKGEASLGLSGGFGGLTLGRFSTIYDDVRALSYTSNVFDSLFTPASNGVFKSGGDYSSRFNNQVRYDLPSMAGFYGSLAYAFESATDKDDGMVGIKLGYKNGPLNVALGTQNEKAKDDDYLALSANYDFGAASVSAGYNSRKGTDAKGDDTELTVGVNVPVGAFDISVGYATSKTEIGGGTSAKASGLGLGATYKMSKRTRLYTALRDIETKDGAGNKTSENRLFALGVRHDF